MTSAPEPEARWDFFICYPSTQRELATRIFAYLKAMNYSVWWDVTSMRPGDGTAQLESAIQRSTHKLVLISPETPSRNYQPLEILRAWTLKKFKICPNLPMVIYTNKSECLRVEGQPLQLEHCWERDLSDFASLEKLLDEVVFYLQSEDERTQQVLSKHKNNSRPTPPAVSPEAANTTHSRALMGGLMGTLATGALGLALLKLSPLILEGEVTSTGNVDGLEPPQINPKPDNQQKPAPPNDSGEAPPLSDGMASPKSEKIAREKAGTRKTKPKQRSISTIQPSPQSVAMLDENRPLHTDSLGVTPLALGRIKVDLTGLGSVQLVEGNLEDNRWTQTLDVRRPPGEYVLAFRQSGQICWRKVTLSDAQQIFQRTVGELCAEGHLSASVPGSEVEPKRQG